MASEGQLGVVSGTALDVQLARRSQLGDPGGHLRRSIARFPDRAIAARVLGGPTRFNAAGEPLYGPRDEVDLDTMRALGKPFWLAGSRGRPGMLEAAQALGAAGIQVGTAFAFCRESGLPRALRQAAVRRVAAGTARVHTDPLASPTGFPFKVAQLAGTLSEPELAERRRRICDLGYLRQLYRRDDGSIGYRCPAEPETAFVRKGGTEEATRGRKCLCNGLVANLGLGQLRTDGARELPLLTAGDDLVHLRTLIDAGGEEYTAADVLDMLLSDRRAGRVPQPERATIAATC